MTITLQDPTLLRDPASRHAFPEMRQEPRLRAPRTLAEEILAGFASYRDRGHAVSAARWVAGTSGEVVAMANEATGQRGDVSPDGRLAGAGLAPFERRIRQRGTTRHQYGE